MASNFAVHSTGDADGLGHGAAGYGCALLALAARTGNRELLEAGREAIAYEQGYYDEAVGAWTDLRDAPDRSCGICPERDSK